MSVIKDINADNQKCDTLKRRFEQLQRMYAIKGIIIRHFRKIDSNSQKIESSSKQIESVYRDSQIILRKQEPPKKFIIQFLDFNLKYTLPIGLGFLLGRLTTY